MLMRADVRRQALPGIVEKVACYLGYGDSTVNSG
jgi:hypothetical protein